MTQSNEAKGMQRNLASSQEGAIDLEEALTWVQRIAFHVCRSADIPREYMEDLISAGYLGLVEAQTRFDLSKGESFKAFAYLRVRGAMIDHIRSSSELSPRAYRYAKALSMMNEMRHEEIEQSDRVDSGNGGSTEFSLEQILEYAANGAIAFRLATSSEELPELQTEKTVETQLIEQEQASILREVVETLPERYRRIIVKCYFEDVSLSEIAREDGVTKSCISKLHKRAIELLRKRFANRVRNSETNSDYTIAAAA